MAENKLKRIDELKARIDQFRPLDKSLLKQIREYFRIGLTYSSNAIEGNSLTETETKVIIEDGITIGGKPLKDHYEAVGHGEAYEILYRFARNQEIREKHIKDLHKIFFYRIDPKNAGKYRNVYTIEKNGVKKLIYQSPWYKDGTFAGLVELSLPIPSEIPHFVRDKAPGN